jgi:hypothetical protein
MIEVPLGIRATKYIGYVTLIDDEKYDLVAPYSWCVWPDGRVLYAARTWREAGRGSKSHFQFMHFPYSEQRAQYLARQAGVS